MPDDIVKEAREALATSYEYDRSNREQAIEDLRFTAGFQWSEAAKNERKGRPMITINRSGQFLRQVSNPIRQNMPIIKAEPDGDDDDEMTEIANGLMRRIQYNSSAAHVYAHAVEHMVSCGIGWMRVMHDYADPEGFDQEIMIKRVFNPLSVYPDPGSQEPARDDMSWCVVSELIPKKAFQAKYPDMKPSGIDKESHDGSASTIMWQSGDYVRIAEYWKREADEVEVALLANGETHELTKIGKRQFEELKAAGYIVNSRKITRHKVRMWKVSGVEQLEEVYECPSKWIPLIPVVGSEIPLDDGVYRHGLIRFQREPQQLHNYAMSVLMESFGQQPKAPIIGTAKQIGPYKSLWDNANRQPTPYLLYDHDPAAPGPPQRLDPAPINAAAVQIAQLAAEDMKASTGIYDASLGARSNETSGVAIAAREEQGNQATFHFVDNLEHSLEHLGRVLLDMIPKVYDTERTLKLMMEDDTEKVVTVNKPMFRDGDTEIRHNDLRQMKFKSVRVALGPNYASRRAEAVQQMVQLVQAFPQVGAIGADLIVKNMDFDGSEQLAERLNAVLPPEVKATMEGEDGMPPQPPPDPMAEMQAQGALRMMEAQGAEAEAKAQEAQAKAASATQNVQVEALQALETLEGTRLDNDLKRKKLSEPPPQANRLAGYDARQ